MEGKETGGSPETRSGQPGGGDSPGAAPAGALAEPASPAAAPAGRVSRLRLALEPAEGARLRVTVEALSEDPALCPSPAPVIVESDKATQSTVTILHPAPTCAGQAPHLVLPSPGAAARRRALPRAWPYSLEQTLFGFSLLVYLAARLVGLASFPIYFFTDEAVQTVLAADLVRDNFKNEEGEFLPTYFKNGPFYNLSASVYLQVIPYLLFGKSVFVTRATSVLVTLLAAGAVGLILREVFRIHYGWAGILLLSIAPAWFLHSRTAFETVLFVSFYAAFLCAYLFYRYRSPRYLNLAVLLAALAFYAYSPGQPVMALTGFLLALSDARYHWQNRAVVLRGLGLLALLALPYLRFRLAHPEAPLDHLSKLGSYWVQPLPLGEKVSRYLSEYLYGLSPGYWFIPNERDLPRHLMKGYGNLLRASLPFAALGFILAVREIRSSAQRAVLIALLAAPAGSALVQVGVTRALVFVIPATLLTGRGVAWVLARLERLRAPRTALSLGLFAALAFANAAMLRDALVNGPTWYHDYGLGGLQYGAQALFAEIRQQLARNPQQKMIVSPAWANGADVVARFFLPDPLPIQMGSIDGHLFERRPLDENTLFVMIPEEYEEALASGKFTGVRVEKTLPYPDGRPGFYFVRLRYVEDIDAILAAERQARRALQTGQVELGGQRVQVLYPLLDIGEIGALFDGDDESLGRTLEANPATIELRFPEPRRLAGFSIVIGSTQAEISARLFVTPQSAPVEFSRRLEGSLEQPEVSLDFGAAFEVSVLILQVRDLRQGEPGHVHIWEISLH